VRDLLPSWLAANGKNGDERASLLAALNGGSRGAVTRHVRHSGVQIVEYALQLGVKPASLLMQIDALARDTWKRVEIPAGERGLIRQ